jgi:hypothetical protein
MRLKAPKVPFWSYLKTCLDERLVPTFRMVMVQSSLSLVARTLMDWKVLIYDTGDLGDMYSIAVDHKVPDLSDVLAQGLVHPG